MQQKIRCQLFLGLVRFSKVSDASKVDDESVGLLSEGVDSTVLVAPARGLSSETASRPCLARMTARGTVLAGMLATGSGKMGVVAACSTGAVPSMLVVASWSETQNRRIDAVF